MMWGVLRERLRHTLGYGEHRERQGSLVVPVEEPQPRVAAALGMRWSAPVAAAAIVALFTIAGDAGYQPTLKLLGQLSAALLVPLLAHLSQFITNVRFWELSLRWDQLAGWQRGVYGTGLVLGANAILLSGAFAVAMLLGGWGEG